MNTSKDYAFVCAIALLIIGANCEKKRRYSASLDSSDFESMSNAVYDVGTRDSLRDREVWAASASQQPGSSSGGGNKLQSLRPEPPFPRRIALKVEDGSSDFRACGGFSGGSSGTCCTACMKLNYKKGCWCRTWDCLCFDS